MKVLAKSVGAAATVIALGASPGASGQSMRENLVGTGRIGGTVDAVGSQGVQKLDGNFSRRLQKKNRNDDALDVNGSVSTCHAVARPSHLETFTLLPVLFCDNSSTLLPCWRSTLRTKL